MIRTTPLLVATLILFSACRLYSQVDIGSIDLSDSDRISASPYSIVIDESGNSLMGYVTLSGNVAPIGEPPEQFSGHHVAEFDLSTLEVTRTFSVGYYPTELLLLPETDELFVSCSTGNSLYRIDLSSGSVSSIEITDSSGNPVLYLSGITINREDDLLYLASNGGDFDGSDENLIVLDRSTLSVVDRHVLPGGISRMVMTDAGRLLVPVGFPGNDYTAPPELWRLDRGGTPEFVVSFPVDTSDFPAPSDICFSTSGSYALVSVFGGSTEIFKVDIDNASLLESIQVPGGDFVQTGIALSPQEDRLAVCRFFENTVSIFDLQSGTGISHSPVGLLPNSLSFGGGRLWVTLQGEERIQILAENGSFVRGDVSMNGSLDISDAVIALLHLFGGMEIPCLESADFDDSDSVDLSDPILLLGFLFTSGNPPAYPWPLPGDDLSPDDLNCGP